MLRVGLLCCACAAAVACGGGRTAPSAPQALPRGARVVAVTDSLLAAGGCDTLRFGRLRSGEIARKRL